MSKYRVLWIDDKCKEMPLLIKKWAVDPKINIELVDFEFAVDGLKAFNADPDKWDAVLLDAQQLYADYSEGTSLEGLRECRDFFKSHSKKVPFFIFTGDPKCMSDRDFAMLMGQRIYKKGDEQDEKDLVRDIHYACDANPERRMREKYADILAFCPKYAQDIIKIGLLVENGITDDSTVFNTMRDILEWVVKYGREHGVFSIEVATPANASTFIQQIKDGNIVPSYMVSIFVSCNETVQNGSHSDDAGENIKVKKDVKDGTAPYLIATTFNSLMGILKWCEGLPQAKEDIDKLRELTKHIKLHQEPLEGVVNQDEEGNFYCKEENGERCCLINSYYAMDNSLLHKRVKLSSMIANKQYPEDSPYPFYTAKNIIVL